MNKERWDNIMATVENGFKVIEKDILSDDRDGGTQIDYVIFEGPLGTMKLEYITKPKVIDKKVTYSNRIGSESKVEYIYSPDEKSEKMKAYKWDDASGDWREIEAGNLNALA